MVKDLVFVLMESMTDQLETKVKEQKETMKEDKARMEEEEMDMVNNEKEEKMKEEVAVGMEDKVVPGPKYYLLGGLEDQVVFPKMVTELYMTS